MAHVVTYQLAYRTDLETTLCASCVERDDHGRGTLGPVSRGARHGMCLGLRHRGPGGKVVGPQDDTQREMDEADGLI